MARVGCFGMSFDPVSYVMGQAAASGGGGNPNTIAEYNATLADPFDGHFDDVWQSGSHYVASMRVSAYLSFSFGGEEVMLMAYHRNSNPSTISFANYGVSNGTLSLFVEILYKKDQDDTVEAVSAKRTDIVNGTATETDLMAYLPMITSSLIVMTHPLPA